MSIKEAFKRLIGVLGNLLGNIKLPEHFHIHFSFLSNNKIEYKKTENKLILDYSKLNSKQKLVITQVVKELLQGDYIIFEEEANKIVKDIQKKDSKFEKIGFFKDKLLLSDYNALETSVYIQSVFEEGKDITKFKRQLIEKFGSRGNTICKLYGAGYFHNLIQPLYAQLSMEKSFVIDDFRKIFDRLIEEFPFAIFVNRTMNANDIIAEIENKIHKNKKYGIQSLNLHGINTVNVKNIRVAIEQLENKGKIKIKSVDEKDKMILVSIEIISS